MSATGVKLRRVVLWMGAALLGASLLSAHVYKQNLYIRLSRESVKLDQVHRLKQNELAGLELDVKELMRRQRLEQLAIHRFGLVYTGAPEVVTRLEDVTEEGHVAMAMAATSENATTGHWVTGAMRWLTDGL